MKTMEEEWENFLRTIYPKGTIPQQALQLRGAFFAGALVAYGAVCRISTTLEENAAMEQMLLFKESIEAGLKAHIEILRAIEFERARHSPGAGADPIS